IKDSFREALASRVLWILLILTTIVLLLLLAPLGIKEQLASTIQPEEILDWPRFIGQLKAEAGSAEPTPGKRIWALCSDRLKRGIEARSAAAQAGLDTTDQQNATRELNAILPRRDFYDEPAWRGMDLGTEAAGLLERGIPQLSDQQVARLNRLLL